ncbi:DUF721 domain-containing protein [Caviibacter abscessus]|uniref:hypothetical protein n=1 Tax=Caviibacter abscessus TaxID=1766719 RepID=UPI0012E34522|nr:hypothetical protein [Caviibacter abscessus]
MKARLYMKAKAITIKNFIGKYNISSKWKEIIGDFIFDYTYFSYNNGNIKIYVNDNNVYNQLNLLKPIVLEKIRNNFEVISLDIIYDKKRVIKKVNVEKVNKVEYDVKKIRKLKEEKYKDIEDQTLKKMLISITTFNEIREKIFESKGYKKCEVCKENFLPVVNEKICVICKNKKEQEKIELAKEKIIEHIYITEEEANKVYNIQKKIYKKAYDKILDNFYLQMIEKIELEQYSDTVDLSEEIKNYVTYYTQSKDNQILSIATTKLISRLKKSAEVLFQKEIDIKG